MAGTPNTNGGNEYGSRVHQATGMVSAQARCNLGEALDRLIERADATGKSLDEIAMAVINRVIRFEQHCF
jgi:hypothetical protein